MICIFGATRDETLYFETKLKNKKEQTILKQYKILTGTILNQEVLIVNDIHTDYLTSAFFTYLIQQYHVILVFVVGKVRTLKDDFKTGTIVVSRQVYLGDVDMIGIGDTKLGQVPNFPSYFIPQSYILDVVRAGFNNIGIPYKMGTYISINKNEKHADALKEYTSGDVIFGEESEIVLDSETGGIFTACQLLDVPCIAIKAVEAQTDVVLSDDHLYDAYKEFPNIGKIVTYCIGQIGRTDTVFTATN